MCWLVACCIITCFVFTVARIRVAHVHMHIYTCTYRHAHIDMHTHPYTHTHLQTPIDRSREPAVRRELRRGGPVLGPVLPRAHQRRVLALVSTHDGRVVWSVTSTHLCLWCVSSGIFMGELARKAIADLRDVRDIVVPHAVQRIYQDNGKLMSDKVCCCGWFCVCVGG